MLGQGLQVASVYAKIGADTGGLDRGLRQSESKLHAFGRTTSGVVGGLAKGMVALGAVSVSALVAVGAAVTTAGFKFNNLSQQGQIAFETMLKSGDKAKAFLAKLQDFAAKTPFEYAQLMEASQKMLAMGFKESDVLPTLTAIGDAVSALGGGQEKIQRVTIALGQLKAKGKVQAEEMLQLTEAGIPAWQMLADAIGTDIPTAMKKVTAGTVDADTAIKALVAGMSERFGGLMSKQSKTFDGLWSTIKDVFAQTSGKLTKPLFEAVTRGMGWLVDMTSSPAFTAGVERFTARFGELIARTESWIKTRGPHLIETFRRATTWIGGMARSAIETAQALIGRLAPTVKTIASVITTTIPGAWRKFKEIVTNVNDPGLAKTVVRLRTAFYGLGKVLAALAQPFKDAFGGLFQALMVARGGGWSNVFDVLITRLRKAMSELGIVLRDQAIPFILTKLGELGTAIKNWFTSVDWGGKFGKWTAAIKNWAGALWEWVQPKLSAFWNRLSAWFVDPTKRQQLWDAVVTGWDVLSGWASAIWNWAKPGLVAGWQWLSSWFTNPEKRARLWNAVKTVWDVVSGWAVAIWRWAKPGLTAGWEWLSGWFTDPAKRQTLWDAVKTGWGVLTDWAVAIWNWASPGLLAGWQWLSGWFTDAQKRTQLWNAIKTGWTWLTDWAIAIWDWAKPHLTVAWQWLSGWFTDETKRSQMWQAIQNGWTWLTDWAKTIWDWVSPHLGNFWKWLTSWVIDYERRQQLLNTLAAAWNQFGLWAGALWGWIEPKLVVFLGEVQTWIDTNHPKLGTWIDAFVAVTTDIHDEWNRVWPTIQGIMTTAKTNITADVASILSNLQGLATWVHGDGVNMGITWGGTFITLATVIAKTAEAITHSVASMVQALNIFGEAANATFAGDWAAMPGIWAKTMAMLESQKGTVVEDIAKFIDPLYWFGVRPGSEGQAPGNLEQFDWWKRLYDWRAPNNWGNNPPPGISVPQNNQIYMPNVPGHAAGGHMTAGGWSWVGERGPELVRMPGGSHVYTSAQAEGLGGTRRIRIDLNVRGESSLPTDRIKLRELAVALQRELQLSGARVILVP